MKLLNFFLKKKLLNSKFINPIKWNALNNEYMYLIAKT